MYCNLSNVLFYTDYTHNYCNSLELHSEISLGGIINLNINKYSNLLIIAYIVLLLLLSIGYLKV